MYFHTHPAFDSKTLVKASTLAYSFNRLTDDQLAILVPGWWITWRIPCHWWQHLSISLIPISSISRITDILFQWSTKWLKQRISWSSHWCWPISFSILEGQLKMVTGRIRVLWRGLPLLDLYPSPLSKTSNRPFRISEGNLDFISGLDASYQDEVLNGMVSWNRPIWQIKLYHAYLNTEYLGFLMDENNLSPSQHLAVRSH